MRPQYTLARLASVDTLLENAPAGPRGPEMDSLTTMANGHDHPLDDCLPATAVVSEAAPATSGHGFESFFSEQYQGLLQFLRRRSRTHEDAEDAAQESLSRFLPYSQTRTAAAWKPTLYRIAINVLNDRSRREHSHRIGEHVGFDEIEVDSGLPSLEEQVEREQQRLQLRDAILALPPKCRQVYLLKRFRGMTNAEIARHCGISVKMVEKHAAKAMLQVRQRLAGGDDA